MSIDVDALLQSFGDEAPCGEDLEYDSDFTELELAAQPKEEQAVGDSVIEGAEPDYKDVVEKATAVLGRSKDIRAAVYLAHASLQLEGMGGFERALAYIRGVLETYWDTCHPQLDADDDNDPTMRVNAVLGLTDNAGVLRSLRRMPLTDSRVMGRFSLRDITAVENGRPVDDGPSDMSAISAAFQDTDAEWLSETLANTIAAQGHVKAIGALMDDKVGALGPDLTPLIKVLHEIRSRVEEYAEGGATAGQSAEDSQAAAPVAQTSASPTPPATSAQVSGGGGGAINSPADVSAALDRICAYYEKNEPSSPVPLLLQRARRLVSADFMTIINDMASNGLDQVRTIGGQSD